MQLKRIRRLKPGLLWVLLTLSPVASALEIEPAVGTGLVYTDNAKLSAHNTDSDEILAGLVGAKITQTDGPFRADADTSLTYEHYLGDTYGDQHWFNLNANAGWQMIRDRVDWVARDYFTQTPINNLDSTTPSNLENTNVFSFGPNIILPVSGRQTFTLKPAFTDFYYENSDADNQQYGASADWFYQLRQDMKIGIDGGATAVRYQKNDQFPDYDIYDLGVVVSGSRPRSQYTIRMGETSITGSNISNQSGFTANLSWLYNITGHSSIEAYAASDLSDSSQQLLNSSINPNTGDYRNVQTSGDVLRSRIFRMTYIRKGSTLDSKIWTELRHLDYKESPDDRKVKEIGAELDYQVTAVLSTGVYGTYNNTKEPGMSLEDKNYWTGVTAQYRLSRKLSTRFDLQYLKRDSTTSADKYTEYSAFVGLIYGFGTVPTPGRYQFGSY
jgi:hypothetical protein